MTIKDIHFNRALDFNPCGKSEIMASDEPCYNQIISTISHELRTPVAIIKSNIQLLRKFSYDIDGKILDESFSLCEESVDDVARFLDDIQLLNSAGKSRIHPVYSPFRIKRIIHHLYSRLAHLNLDYNRILLQWDLTEHEIISDKKFLSQILLHIISNALKFSIEKIQIIISTCNHDLSILVQDRGIGISDEEIEMIFQPFYRASNVRHIAGTGLGLAIVHALVETLGGGIHISSSIGKGTTIQINIPYVLPDEDISN